MADDLLTIQTGDIGVTTVVPPSLAGANCHALVISRFDKRTSDPGYYCQYFNSERGRLAFKEIETGSTMKHLNVGDMVKLFVPLPPLPEQRAIATALSDVDALLSKLDQFIAKKRDLKQAAMQKLLTGQTRLPGFGGEWGVNPFGDVLSRVNAKEHQIQTSDYQKTGDYPVVDQGKELVIGFSDRSDKRFQCPEDGVIVFGELSKKSPQCLEYIVVHELVHLLERHHNDRFTDLMSRFMPQWRHYRKELTSAPLAHETWNY